MPHCTHCGPLYPLWPAVPLCVPLHPLCPAVPLCVPLHPLWPAVPLCVLLYPSVSHCTHCAPMCPTVHTVATCSSVSRSGTSPYRGEVAFLHTLHLKNPWNENKPVKISRDGQEVEPGVGEELCRLWIEHAEKPTASSQRTAPLPRKQNRPQDGGGSHGIHRHGLPMAAVPIIPAVQYQQYLQHHSMMKGPHSFGIGSVPHFNPLQSGALSTSRSGLVETG